jgi:F0F1-type ATP synthase beta subunit
MNIISPVYHLQFLKNKKIPQCRNNSKIQKKNHKRCKIDTLNTLIQDRILSELGIDTLI